MRSMTRNKRPIYYALYLGYNDVTDSNGDLTGEKRITYTTPVLWEANYNPGGGTTVIAQFGTDESYTRIISTSDMNCPINEQSLLWIERSSDEAPNYKVTAVRRSINSIRYVCEQITTAYTGSSSLVWDVGFIEGQSVMYMEG